MFFLTLFHAISLLFLTLVGVLVAFRADAAALAFWFGWAVYVGLFIGFTREKVWCVRLSVVPPALLFIATAPFVAYNFFEYFDGHSVYEDSPATIIIVAIITFFITLPSLGVLLAYGAERRKVFGP